MSNVYGIIYLLPRDPSLNKGGPCMHPPPTPGRRYEIFTRSSQTCLPIGIYGFYGFFYFRVQTQLKLGGI